MIMSVSLGTWGWLPRLPGDKRELPNQPRQGHKEIEGQGDRTGHGDMFPKGLGKMEEEEAGMATEEMEKDGLTPFLSTGSAIRPT